MRSSSDLSFSVHWRQTSYLTTRQSLFTIHGFDNAVSKISQNQGHVCPYYFFILREKYGFTAPWKALRYRIR